MYCFPPPRADSFSTREKLEACKTTGKNRPTPPIAADSHRVSDKESFPEAEGRGCYRDVQRRVIQFYRLSHTSGHPTNTSPSTTTSRVCAPFIAPGIRVLFSHLLSPLPPSLSRSRHLSEMFQLVKIPFQLFLTYIRLNFIIFFARTSR